MISQKALSIFSNYLPCRPRLDISDPEKQGTKKTRKNPNGPSPSHFFSPSQSFRVLSAATPMAESSSMEKSDAEREEMLDRMLTRLALADDSKLQGLLSKILPYCISSLSSQSQSLRKKVNHKSQSQPLPLYVCVDRFWNVRFVFRFCLNYWVVDVRFLEVRVLVFVLIWRVKCVYLFLLMIWI